MSISSFIARSGTLVQLFLLAGPVPAQTGSDPVSALIQQIYAGQCKLDVDEPAPGLHPIDEDTLNRLQRAIPRYEQIVRSGGWPVIPRGRTIRPGDHDKRMTTVRARLRIGGDLFTQAPAGQALVADASLIGAVKRFQGRHGLKVDGRIGPNTREAMNVPAFLRLIQLRTNLKRLERLFRTNRARRHVMVNIPDFSLAAIEDQTVVLSSRVIVGRTDRQTPQFDTAIRAVTFHPTWTVPSSIVQRDLYPKFKSDPGYFSRGDFLLSGAADGLLIDPTILPDMLLTPEMVRIQQLPGPKNALGLIRLEMPNRYAVFLHDTSAPDLYQQEKRSMSSGCIRVEQIIELTQWLLSELAGWDRNRIDDVLVEKATLTVRLREPVPVFLIYVTAWLAIDDSLPQFRRDMYQLDTLPVTTGP